MFKDPLERLDQRGGPILSHEDIKSIFGNVPEILSVHRHLVVRRREGGRGGSQRGDLLVQVEIYTLDPFGTNYLERQPACGHYTGSTIHRYKQFPP